MESKTRTDAEQEAFKSLVGMLNDGDKSIRLRAADLILAHSMARRDAERYDDQLKQMGTSPAMSGILPEPLDQ